MNKKLTALAVFAAVILSCACAFADTFEEVMKRAETGDAQSQLDIAVAYFQGGGVKENHEEGAKWMLKAAENGLAKAQFGAGLMYENGEGVKQSHEETAKWYLRAAEQGYA
ncbi:MAG: sel1 repeat family protein [Synergistaceae bacterium]|nr:sel1 repeat family protein [Synergistaceae bacterium]